jgi:hypothetical protein
MHLAKILKKIHLLSSLSFIQINYLSEYISIFDASFFSDHPLFYYFHCFLSPYVNFEVLFLKKKKKKSLSLSLVVSFNKLTVKIIIIIKVDKYLNSLIFDACKK